MTSPRSRRCASSWTTAPRTRGSADRSAAPRRHTARGIALQSSPDDRDHQPGHSAVGLPEPQVRRPNGQRGEAPRLLRRGTSTDRPSQMAHLAMANRDRYRMPTLSEGDQCCKSPEGEVPAGQGEWACRDDCADRYGFDEADVVGSTRAALACSIRVASADATVAPSRLSSRPLFRALTVRRSSSRLLGDRNVKVDDSSRIDTSHQGFGCAAVGGMRPLKLGHYQRGSCRSSPRRRFSKGCVPKVVGRASEHVSSIKPRKPCERCPVTGASTSPPGPLRPVRHRHATAGAGFSILTESSILGRGDLAFRDAHRWRGASGAASPARQSAADRGHARDELLGPGAVRPVGAFPGRGRRGARLRPGRRRYVHHARRQPRLVLEPSMAEPHPGVFIRRARRVLMAVAVPAQHTAPWQHQRRRLRRRHRPFAARPARTVPAVAPLVPGPALLHLAAVRLPGPQEPARKRHGHAPHRPGRPADDPPTACGPESSPRSSPASSPTSPGRWRFR